MLSSLFASAGSLGALADPKMARESPKRRPKRPHDSPRSAHKLPQRAPGRPERPPRRPREGLGRPRRQPPKALDGARVPSARQKPPEGLQTFPKNSWEGPRRPPSGFQTGFRLCPALRLWALFRMSVSRATLEIGKWVHALPFFKLVLQLPGHCPPRLCSSRRPWTSLV